MHPKLFLALLLFAFHSKCFGLVEGKFGKLDASASLGLTYDSRVFMLPSNEFSAIKKSEGSAAVPVSEMKSEDDLIITFSPAMHYSNKFGLLKISGSAGFSVSHYFFE